MTRSLILAVAAIALLAAVPASAEARSNRSVDDNGAIVNCDVASGQKCDDRVRGHDDAPNHDIGDDHGRRHGGHGADDDSNDDHGGDWSGSDDHGSDDRGGSSNSNSGNSSDSNSGGSDNGGSHGGGDDSSGRH